MWISANLQQLTPTLLLILLSTACLNVTGCVQNRSGAATQEVDFQCKDCNVILISIDSLRADHLGIYGYQRDTSPNIDALAQHSLVFDKAISQASWTLPSHLALFASRHPSSVFPHSSTRKTVVHSLKDTYPQLPDLTSLLREHGYVTAAVTEGEYLSSVFRWTDRFDSYEPLVRARKVKLTKGEKLALPTAKEISEHAGVWLEQNKDKPFFLFLRYPDIHCPYVIPAKFDVFDSKAQDGDAFVAKCTRAMTTILTKLSKTERHLLTQKIISLYDSGILHVDFYLGKLFADLKALGLDKNTIVVVLADHGEALGERSEPKAHQSCHKAMYVGHAASVFNETLHVPLILRHPNLQAMRIPYRVRLIDVAPTLLELLGIKPPAFFEGTSLIPLLTGDEQANREVFALSEQFRRESCGSMSVFKDDLKYILRYSQTLDHDEGFFYDLSNDPDEITDLSERFPEATQDLRATLTNWLEQTRQKEEALQQEISRNMHESQQSPHTIRTPQAPK